ncbi:hypothetical protein RND81_09G026900 [Saponaria officinalis]|uniref:Uncharacterized protein n=1 Tax=Saponaria officinalis TaxID=3572 RepID=A0AAW1IHZ8_SAPOF
MTTLSPQFIFTKTNTFHKNYSIYRQLCPYLPKSHQPVKNYCQNCSKFGAFHEKSSNFRSWGYKNAGLFHELKVEKDGFLWGEKNLKNKRVVLVKFNQGFNFNNNNKNNKDDGINVRVLGNLALAVGLTYLTMSGQLGWVLDTIVSLWLLSIALPVVGFIAFLWWAKQDIVQSACPNCGNDFQVFKSSLNDEVQLCPFCSQPFSVEGNDFVKEPIKFSNRSSPFGQPVDDFSPWSGKGKSASTTVVDVEAEIKDAE